MEPPTQNKKSRGGARPGAGRKKMTGSRKYTLILTPQQREKIKALGGAQALRDLIDKA